MIKDLYIDCPTGIAGDMLLAGFIDLGLPDDFLPIQIKSLGLEKVLNINSYEDKSYGLRGIKLHLEKIDSFDFDRSWVGIENFINKSSLKDSIRNNSLTVFKELAEAEACVHGCKLNDVHFHEIGSLETLINIVGVCSAIDYFNPENIYCSPLPCGKGTVNTSHGILPVPVPTVLEIARKKNIPLSSSANSSDGELTTPSGIALMSVFASSYYKPACFEVLSLGIGLGSKDFKRSNILRICQIRNSLVDNYHKPIEGLHWQKLIMQEAWIDDSSPEDLADLASQLRRAGAIEVSSHSVQMKKGRQGVHMQAIINPQFVKDVRLIWLTKGASLGLRESSFGRWVLPRRLGYCNTSLGKVKLKQVMRPDGSFSIKPEHDDLIELSEKTGKSLDEIRKEIYLYLDKFIPQEDWKF